MNRFLILLFLLISSKYSNANNISIQRVSLIDTNRVAKTISVRINISWDNSWRDDINWDAAWIFFKYKEPKDSIWKWRHGTMSKTGNFPGNSNAALKFVVPDDLKGAFLYRQANGSGNVKSDSLTFLWNYGNDGVLNIDSVEVRVFATEMVYVAEGMFSIGDGNGQRRSFLSFQLKNAPNNYVTITDKWSPLINTFIDNINYGRDDINLYRDGIRISGLEGLDVDGNKSSDFINFPTGYRAFYAMKYEVTQGQYADFLNTLSLKDTNTNMFYVDTFRLKRVNPKYKLALQNLDPHFNFKPTELYRHTISLDSVEVKYRVSRPDRAYGMANQNQFVSFIDWAGLRPMSELEFEKACRGPLPPYYWTPTGNTMINDTLLKWQGGDWSWGNDTTVPRISNMYGNQNILNYSGIENGTESFSNYEIQKRYINPTVSTTGGNMPGMISFSGGDGGSGPFRVGIFANDSSSRISSGASYYGIMDLSKNVSEFVVSISSNTARTLSYKIHGDGILNAIGESQDFYRNNFFGPEGNPFFTKSREISDRSANYSQQGITGFRGVRTATPDN
jgi:formylglycine-generating enzyme required for sulfatase activity